MQIVIGNDSATKSLRLDQVKKINCTDEAEAL